VSHRAGTLARARDALRSSDFRALLASRLTSQLADGFFQAYLVAQLVFLNPDKGGTAAGVARAYALLVIPFSVVGPLSGVFIDRWSRRRILWATPLIRAAACVILLPLRGTGPVLYAASLVVVSLNRFFLSTASAVMPTLVPGEDLLVGNSMATVGGTVVTFAGIVLGTKLVDPWGARGVLLVAAVGYPLASWISSRLRDPLRPRRVTNTLGEHLSTVARELWAGGRRLAATPVALGSIVSISLEQFLVGFVTVLSLVVFKEQFREGVGSYGNILAAGGAGVLAGTLTVGWLESKLPKPRIVALSFVLAGVVALAVAPHVVGTTILALSFVLGLTFAWGKIPVDTMVQEAIPDRYRGRAFAVYDIVYAMARVLAAGAAVVVIPHVSTPWIVAVVGVIFLGWSPVIPWWLGRPQRVGLRFHAGGRADEVPRAMVIGGEDEPVEVVGSSLHERGSGRIRRFEVRTADGALVHLTEDGPKWRIG